MSPDAKLVAQLGVEPSPFASEATVLETVCASRTLLRNKKSKEIHSHLFSRTASSERS